MKRILYSGCVDFVTVKLSLYTLCSINLPHRKWLPWETTVVIPNTHSCWMLILMLLFPNKMIWWINVEYPDNEKENLSCKPNQRQIMVQKMAPENSGSRSRKGFFLRTKTKESSHVNASYVGLFLVLTQSFFHVSVVLARPTFRNNSHWFLLFLLKTQLLLSQKYLFVPCLPHSLYSWKPAIDPLRGQTFFILPLSFTFSL